MTDADKAGFELRLTDMGKVFGWTVADAHLYAYWQVLRNFGRGEFNRACDKALEECRRMPSPAQLKDYAKSMRQGQSLPDYRPTRPWTQYERWEASQLLRVSPRAWYEMNESQRSAWGRERQAEWQAMTPAQRANAEGWAPGRESMVTASTGVEPDRRLPRESGDDDLGDLPF